MLKQHVFSFTSLWRSHVFIMYQVYYRYHDDVDDGDFEVLCSTISLQTVLFSRLKVNCANLFVVASWCEGCHS